MSHWYLPDGTPFYEIEKLDKSGLRNVTLRDARKKGAFPSVSGIIQQIGKPSLTRWLLLQLLNVVSKFKHWVNKEENWQDRLIQMSEVENSRFAQIGNQIHNMFEQYYLTGKVEPENESLVYPVIEYVQNELTKPHKIIKFEVEKAFAHKDGYGGKIDLIIHTEDGIIIVDFKTKHGKDLSEKKLYDDYKMQLAAYKNNFKGVLFCANILISVDYPGEFYGHVWSEADMKKGTDMFYCLLNYWKLANNYNPTEETA